MATRPFTDITTSISANAIKNGTALVSTGGFIKGTTTSLFYKAYDKYVNNTPAIATIQSQYGNRFYNGLFVNGVDNGTI
jgi:uncharacterized protein YaaQ